MPKFDIAAALADGYSYSEIASYLSELHGFDLNAAKYDGIGEEEVAGFLSAREVRPPVESDSDFGAGVKQLGRLAYDFPTQVQGAAGALMYDPLEPEGTGARWMDVADKRNRERAAQLELEGTAEKKFLPGISVGNVQDASSSTGFSAVAMGPSIAGEIGATLAAKAPNPAVKLGGQALSYLGGAAGSAIGGKNMDEAMFTKQLLERANQQMLRTDGRPMTAEETRKYLDETAEIRSQHGLWEAGPEAVGNALEVIGLRKIFSGMAKGNLLGAVAGLVMNQATEHSTETITGMGQQPLEVAGGLREENPYDMGSPQDWATAFKGQAPVTAVLGGVTGGAAGIAGRAYRAVQPPLQAAPEPERQLPDFETDRQQVEGLQVPTPIIPPLKPSDFAGISAVPDALSAMRTQPTVTAKADTATQQVENATTPKGYGNPLDTAGEIITAVRGADEAKLAELEKAIEAPELDDFAAAIRGDIADRREELAKRPETLPADPLTELLSTISTADQPTLLQMADGLPGLVEGSPELAPYQRQLSEAISKRQRILWEESNVGRGKVSGDQEGVAAVHPEQPAGVRDTEPVSEDSGQLGDGEGSTGVEQASPLLTAARQHVAETGDMTMGGLMKALDVDIDTAEALLEQVKATTPLPRNIGGTQAATVGADTGGFLTDQAIRKAGATNPATTAGDAQGFIADQGIRKAAGAVTATPVADTEGFVRDQQIRRDAMGRGPKPTRAADEPARAFLARKREWEKGNTSSQHNGEHPTQAPNINPLEKPWMLTKEEYHRAIQSRFGMGAEARQSVGAAFSAGRGGELAEGVPYRQVNYEQHARKVARAIRSGEAVPAGVLAEYPGYLEKYRRPPATMKREGENSVSQTGENETQAELPRTDETQAGAGGAGSEPFTVIDHGGGRASIKVGRKYINNFGGKFSLGGKNTAYKFNTSVIQPKAVYSAAVEAMETQKQAHTTPKTTSTSDLPGAGTATAPSPGEASPPPAAQPSASKATPEKPAGVATSGQRQEQAKLLTKAQFNDEAQQYANFGKYSDAVASDESPSGIALRQDIRAAIEAYREDFREKARQVENKLRKWFDIPEGDIKDEIDKSVIALLNGESAAGGGHLHINGGKLFTGRGTRAEQSAKKIANANGTSVVFGYTDNAVAGAKVDDGDFIIELPFDMSDYGKGDGRRIPFLLSSNFRLSGDWAYTPKQPWATRGKPPLIGEYSDFMPKQEQAAKEPWQMTLAEYREFVKQSIIESGSAEDEAHEAAYIDKPRRGYMPGRSAGENHKLEVITALRQGRPVPAKVREDYPELDDHGDIADAANVLAEYPELADAKPRKDEDMSDVAEPAQTEAASGEQGDFFARENVRKNHYIKRKQPGLGDRKVPWELVSTVSAEGVMVDNKTFVVPFDQITDIRTGMPDLGRGEVIFKDGAPVGRKVSAQSPSEKDAETSSSEADKSDVSPKSPNGDIVEHTTKRGKVIRGRIVTGISYRQAKAADPYTFKKDGGFFIREGAGEVKKDNSPSEVKETAPEKAEAQPKENLAIKRLRISAERLKAAGEAKLNQDRNVNTARRARMANNAEADARADIRTAETLLNIVNAQEDGTAGALAGLTSKAQLETLQGILTQAKYAEERKKENGKQDHARPANKDDIKSAVYLYPHFYDYKDLDALIDLLGNKKGWRTKRNDLRRGGLVVNGKERIEMLREALKLAGDDYRFRTVGEQLRGYDRLQKAGITDDLDLREALERLVELSGKAPEKNRAQELERALVGQNNGIDFFPTPKAQAKFIVDRAGIEPGMRVLEPSAGTGNLAEEMRAQGGEVEVAEISPAHREVLEAKGFKIVEHDFMDMEEGGYDVIVMNPPFSNNMDIDHVRKAYELLKPGGRVVAIMGEGAFFRTGKKETEFREWLDEVGINEKLPEGFFTDKKELRTTGVNARVVEIDKPDVSEDGRPVESNYKSAREYLAALQQWREETGNANEYEQRREERADRIEARADKLNSEAAAAFERSAKIGERFHGGQPILVGHHSEKSARAAQAKMHSAMDKSVDLGKRADEAAYRAEAARRNKAISSDDEDAIVKLKAKIEAAEEEQAQYKAINKALRVKDTVKGDAELAKQGYTAEQIVKLREPDFMGRVGIPDYRLTNNNANIRRMKQRLESLERNRQDETQEFEFDGGKIIDNVEDNRVQIDFDAKPSAELREALKGSAFAWAPSVSMWQRKRGGNALYAAKRIVGLAEDGPKLSTALPPSSRADIPGELTQAFGKLRARVLMRKITVLESQEEAKALVRRLGGKLSAAWHGSPHDFDEFRMSAIGTGEGAQAYGYGLYFAGAREVAEYYKKALSVRNLDKQGFVDNFLASMPDAPELLPRNMFAWLIGGESGARAAHIAYLHEPDVRDYVRTVGEAKIGAAAEEAYKKQQGRLYKVELAPQEDEYLLWDRPLSEQSEKVRAALEKARISAKFAKNAVVERKTGNEWYSRLSSEFGDKRAASEYLHSLGIRGIKYLDGTSRSKGEGAYNYVIFDESDVEITAKYSKNGAIQGIYANGTTYLVADGIAKNQAVPVLLHELGEHAAQLGFAGDSEYQGILRSLEKRAEAQNATGEAIRAAMARVPEDTLPEHYWSEVAAYLVENKANGEIGIVKRILNFFKRWLYKAGAINADRLTPDDLVLFARSATLAHTGATYGEGMRQSVRDLFKPVDTESAAFRDWARGSVVRDVQYHWTNAEFDAFDMEASGGMAHFGTKQAAADRAGGHDGIGYDIEEDDGEFWVYADAGPNDGEGVGPFKTESEAKKYIKTQPKRIAPIAVYLNIKNPLRVPDFGVWTLDGVRTYLYNENVINKRDADKVWKAWQNSSKDGYEALRLVLEKKGYDGFVYENEQEDPGSDSYVVLSPTQIKSATENTGDFSPSDPRIRYSKRFEADEAEIVERVTNKYDIFPGARAFLTPEYTLVRDPAGKRAFDAARKRATNKHEFGNWILDGTTPRDAWDEESQGDYADHYTGTNQTFLNAMNALNEAEYKQTNDYLTDADKPGSKPFRVRHIKGFEVRAPDGTFVGFAKDKPATYDLKSRHHRMNYGENSDVLMVDYKTDPIDKWIVFDGRTPVGRFEEEAKAIQAMMDKEGEKLAGKGFSEKSVGAVRVWREMTNRAFDLEVSELRKIEAQRAAMGLPPLEFDMVDETKRWAVKDRQGNLVATYEFKEDAELHLRELAKYKAGFANVKITRQSDSEIMGTGSIHDYISMLGDLRGSYFPRQRPSGGIVLTATNADGRKVREHFDLWISKGRKYDGTNADENALLKFARGNFNALTPLGRRIRALEKEGFKREDIVVEKAQPMPEEVYDVTGLASAINALMDESLQNVKDKSKASPKLESAFAELHKAMTANLANIFKERGGLSSRIRRNPTDYWEGFETDMKKAGVQYARRMAATIAKRQAAQEITLALTGRDISFDEFKAKKLGTTWEEYADFVNKRKLDPKTQPNLYGEAMSWTKEVLRNDEQVDRIIGTLRGLATLKFLGLRVSSAAVNLTNLLTGAAGTISHHSGGSIPSAIRQITRSLRVMADYKQGKAEGIDKKVITEIKERGLDQAQFNHEAMGVLRSKAGNAGAWISDKMMAMFGFTERINRTATIHAAYMEIKRMDDKKPVDARMTHAKLMEKAEIASNRGHGLYGPLTAPMWTRGSGNPLRMTFTFMKFSQSYMMNMGDMVRKKDYKNAAYLLLSPAILGGLGASAATPVIMGIARALGMGDDPEEELYTWAAEVFGSDTVMRHGLPGLLGVNLKGSLAVNNPMPTTIEELFGAPGSLFFDIRDAVRETRRGAYGKAAEKFFPTGVVAPFKALREYDEGVTTGSYSRVHYGNEPLKATGYDAVLRAFSFNPSRISGIREKQWSEDKIARKYRQERTDINTKVKKAWLKGNGKISHADWLELMAEVESYNERVKGLNLPDITPITKKALRLLLRRQGKPNKRERLRTNQNI